MGNRVCSKSFSVLKRNFLSFCLFGTSIVLAVILKEPVSRFPSFVDWKTIITLTGLLLITTAIKESGFFYLSAYRISKKITNERILALFLIFLSASLAMFLTNDVALFIIVPLTLSIQEISGNDYSKMVIFEAIAANVGSSLTSIGNPQNIFLWHRWKISFHVFIAQMSLPVLIMALWLLVFVIVFFPRAKIKLNNSGAPAVDKKLFYLSLILLIFFIVSIELEIEQYFLAIVFISIFLLRKKNIGETDWGLIFLFIFLFIDLNLIGRLKITKELPALINFHNPHKLFLASALLSQAISNVPAAILLAGYSSDFKIIAYGVNIGGNGLLIASFANLIALRFLKDRSHYLKFHIYSVPYFLITLGFCYYFLI